jgi:3-dehydroquinate synthase
MRQNRPDGEKAKTWKALGTLLDTLVSRGLRRDGGIVALGGGTVGDVAGLAAALALRGVPIVQVPTTLLAASDSALGGKTAVDLPAGKNLAGVVHQPALVLVDTNFLATLPERDVRSGLAEIVKTSFLDEGFHRRMDRLVAGLRARDSGALAEGAWRSLEVKAGVVARDPEERSGARFVLNLGHTAGHALETASGHRLRHGEAVAWGLLTILELSRERGLAEREAWLMTQRVIALVSPPRLSQKTLATWLGFLGADKKADAAGLRVVTLEAPGRPRVERTTPQEIARAFERALRAYNLG